MMLERETVAFCPRSCRAGSWDVLDRAAMGMHYSTPEICHGCSHSAQHLHETHQFSHLHERHLSTNGHLQQHCIGVQDDDLQPCQGHQRCEGFIDHQGLFLQPRANTGTASCCSIDAYEKVMETGSSRAIPERVERPPFCTDPLHFPAMAMANPPCRLTVGYALTAKKAQSFVKPGLIKNARSKGIIFSAIDCNKPLVEQGPFDVILQKISNNEWHQQLKVYKQMKPKVWIFDSPEAIRKVYNRKSMLQEVADLRFHNHHGRVSIPRQLVVDGESAEVTARESLTYPLVAKPLWIDGTARSHALSLAFNESGVSHLTKPLVLQEFVNHGGVLFKVYVFGHIIRVVRRPSLPDICGDQSQGNGVVPFPRVSSARASAAAIDLTMDASVYPPEEMLLALTRLLRARLGLSLFNLDMIRENGRGNQYYVIDINYFPGYGKVPGYEWAFTDFLSHIAEEKEQAQANVEPGLLSVGTSVSSSPCQLCRR